MKILIISDDLPTPPHEGGAHRFYSMCRGLAERGELIIASRQANTSAPEVIALFSARFSLPPAPAPSFLGKLNHRLHLGCHLRDDYRRPGYLRGLRSLVDELIENHAPDIVYVNGPEVAQFVCWKRRQTPVVIDLCDSFSLLYRRKALFEPTLRLKLLDHAESRALLNYEKEICRYSSHAIFVSEVDRAEIHQHQPPASLWTVPLVVDSEFFSPDAPLADPYPAENSVNILFSGVMNYVPNVDAAVWFATQVFSKLRAVLPDARFWIVGKDPSPAITALDAIDGVTVTGTVPDIRNYIKHASVVVSPLRIGAGVKTKILTALAMEARLICTPLSIEGTSLRDGRELATAQTAEEFAAKITELFQNPERASQLAAEGRKAILARHCMDAQNGALFKVLDRACAR